MEITAPSRPPGEETWNLLDLFPDDAAFQRARLRLAEDLLPALESFRGRVVESAATLADALETDSLVEEQLRLLHAYASMKSDQDVRVAANQAQRQGVDLLVTEASRRGAFLRPEILAASGGQVESFLAEEPRLEAYAHVLLDLMRQRAHVLGPAEERILAETGLMRREPNSLYQILTHGELPRREVTLAGGETVRLTTVAFQKHRARQQRADRLLLFPEYFRAYADFKDTLGQNLYAALKTHLFHMRARGYDSCLSAALDPDNVPQRVYRNLIEQVRGRLPVLHRYFRLRARRLGLPHLEYPDLHCPLTETPPKRYAPAEARRLVRDALAPLGPAYVSDLEGAFRGRWIDWHPGPGKRSGAYASGGAYRVHPYVLLNYNGDYESVSTLAHEMGHAMHSHSSNRAQPIATASYSIFVAEVASTFNEALLLRQLFGEARTPEERLFLISSYLDGIRGTLFRQTMFAEFELEIHERAERGEVLTGEALSEIYLCLLRRYHGHDEGVVRIADGYAVEWAAIPHLYYNFYVYQYATGIIAASALARAVTEDEPGARERYLRFLSRGSSDYPLELLRDAGVDLERPAPYDEAFSTLEGYLDELERGL